jgi:hypothetical protein
MSVDYLATPIAEIYKQLMATPARDHVSGNLGEGTFSYVGAQGVDNPQVTIWQLSFYGGLKLGDDRDGISGIGAMTGPKRVFETAAIKAEFLAELNSSR